MARDCVSEINVQLKGQITQFCHLLLCGVIIKHITRTRVVTNPYDILSLAEHKRRCVAEGHSQSLFTYIVGKKMQ